MHLGTTHVHDGTTYVPTPLPNSWPPLYPNSPRCPDCPECPPPTCARCGHVHRFKPGTFKGPFHANEIETIHSHQEGLA